MPSLFSGSGNIPVPGVFALSVNSALAWGPAGACSAAFDCCGISIFLSVVEWDEMTRLLIRGAPQLFSKTRMTLAIRSGTRDGAGSRSRSPTPNSSSQGLRVLAWTRTADTGCPCDSNMQRTAAPYGSAAGACPLTNSRGTEICRSHDIGNELATWPGSSACEKCRSNRSVQERRDCPRFVPRERAGQ